MKRIKRLIVVALFAFTMILPITVSDFGNTVYVSAATIGLNKKTLSLEQGKTYVLEVTGTKSKVTWKSSNKSIATVSSKGKVTAKSPGTAKITATVGGKKYTCKVTVKKVTVALNKKSLSLEQEQTYVLKIKGTESKVTWKSSDKTIATVTSKGKVTAKSPGTAKITATVDGKKYTCKVTVSPSYETIEEFIEDFSLSIPKDWIFYVEPIFRSPEDTSNEKYRYVLRPEGVEYGNSITITAEIFDKVVDINYEDNKEMMSDQFKAYLKDTYIDSLIIKEIGSFTSNLGSGLKALYEITYDNITYYYTAYMFYYENYGLTVEVSQTKELGLNTVVMNLINSIK